MQDDYFESVTLDCMPCLGTPAMTFGVSIAVMFALLLLFLIFKRCVWRRMNKRGRRRMRATLKIVFVFYQLVTQVPKVYDVSLPNDVEAFLESIAVAVSLGLPSIATTPLECFGLAGYHPRLIFWMTMPIVFMTIVVVLVLSYAAYQRRFRPPKAIATTQNGSHVDGVKQRATVDAK